MDTICDYKECRLLLENPITLPCANTVCLEHLDQFQDEKSFSCLCCTKKHSVPEDGFTTNPKFINLIEKELNANSCYKQANSLLKEMEAQVRDFEKDVAQDPANFIYEYFFELRNKIDLHREQMIKKLQDKSEELIKRLEKLERECKENAEKVKLVDLT